MLSFENDYNVGAHPQVLKALMDTNLIRQPGYGNDDFCRSAAEKIRAACACPEAEVFFISGGTQTNQVVISSLLRSYEGVLSAVTGHVNGHEAGAIEYSGHKVLTLPQHEGKIDWLELEAWIKSFYADESHEHMVFPGMVYISHPTEYGTLYSKAELESLSQVCRRYDLPLFLDGARLGYGLMSRETDLRLEDIARLCDVFYIGGTKIGALFGEALIIMNDNMNDHFRYMVKRACALLAKGRLIAIQLKALLEGGEYSLYYELSRHENELAIKLSKGVVEKGYELWIPHQTNQVFVIVDNDKIKELEKDFFFYTWCPYDETRSVIRLVISWGSTEEDVDAILAAL